ncbi:MAG: hypothetical protein AAF267_22120 [Deinococcota bacterium]
MSSYVVWLVTETVKTTSERRTVVWASRSLAMQHAKALVKDDADVKSNVQRQVWTCTSDKRTVTVQEKMVMDTWDYLDAEDMP